MDRQRPLTYDPLKVASRIYLHLGPIEALVRREIGDALGAQGYGLSGSDHAVLSVITMEADGATVAHLADLLAIPRTSARRTVDQLHKHDLVVKQQESHDRRYWRWLPTAQARALVAAVAGPPGDGAFARSVAGLEAGDAEVLITDLSALLGGLHPTISRPIRVDEAGTPYTFFELWLGISRAWRMVRDEQSRFLLRQTDGALESGGYQTLYYVHETPAASGNGIASFLRVDQNTALRITDRLESLGLVTRTRNPADRRQVVIAATPRGEELLAAVPPLDAEGPFVRLVGDLPDGGVGLADVIERLAQGLVNEPIINLAGLDSLLDGLARQTASTKPSTVDSDEFRAAMSRFLTGVAVVTVGRDGEHRGVTVNSLTSVSLDPPTLLICFDRRSPALERIKQHQAFAANILSAEQQHLAERFGRRESEENPHTLDEGMWTEIDGVPALVGSLATVVCDVADTYDAGSHTIVLAAPRHLGPASPQTSGALGFWKSRYLHVAGEESRTPTTTTEGKRQA